ncbi:MAG: DUF362 domain-containing protein [Candidatus Eisenbacteria sp.]|nr:DUF362 domain-containing protein [Candidatus Eisenbacteria bacterium]
MTSLSRRELLRRIGIGLIGLPPLLHPTPARTAEIPRCVLAKNADPSELTRRAIAALGGMERFVSKGTCVVIKPNIGWDRTPQQGATTHPEVVATLVALSLRAGAKKVHVMDHTCNDARRCYRRSGIEKAAKAAGAKMVHLRPGRGVPMKVGAELLGNWPVFREVVEADVLINVPIAKHHSLSRATLGMKNWFGAVDGRRDQLHQDVALASVEMAAFFKPHLTVLDGTRVLLRNGPQGGNLDDLSRPHMLMAGTDPVAIDAFGGSLLGLTPEDLPHIGMAEERGLGSRKWNTADVTVLDLG